MNIENLNKMADYLEKGDFGKDNFDMANVCTCVLGHAVKVFEGESPASAAHMDRIARRIFNIDYGPKFAFCFGGAWPNDRLAAADRLRYVALHGDCPSFNQWKNFQHHRSEQISEWVAPADLGQQHEEETTTLCA